MKALMVQTLFLWILFTHKGFASSPIPNCDAEGYQYSLGSDLSPWVMNGYSFFYTSLSGNCRLTIEAWQIQFPDFITELNSHNKGKEWRRKANGVSLFLDTFYSMKDEGWYSGIVLSTFRSTVSRIDHLVEKSFRSYEVLLRFGYKYNLTEHISLDPWFAVGPIVTDGREPEVLGETFQESMFQVLGTVHLSYKINTEKMFQ